MERSMTEEQLIAHRWQVNATFIAVDEGGMKLKIAVNGKFLHCKTSGIVRVATQVLTEIDRRLVNEAGLRQAWAFELFVPPRTNVPFTLQQIPTRVVGRCSGQIWEQLEFPLRSRGWRALNFTSTGPVLKRNSLSVIHDAQVFRTPESFPLAQRVLHQLLNPLNGRLHRRIVTVSEFSQQELEHFWVTPPRKAQVIHNAADHVLGYEAEPEILERFNLGGRIFLLANGYTQAHKNVALLFDAMRYLARSDVELVLFGNIDPQGFARQRAELGDRVKFTGRISDGELRALFEHAALFLFPSKTEGFGLPPLEAMALGCPCLVSDAGAVPDVCKDGAAYAPPDDPRQWAKRIGDLLGDDSYVAKLRSKGRKVAAGYSWSKAAGEYLDALRIPGAV